MRLLKQAALLPLLVLAGCAGSEGQEAGVSIGPELFLGADQAQINDVLLEQELLFQELIAECMAGEGFDYFPRNDSSETEAANQAFRELVGDEAVGLSAGLPSAEYASEWGYGIARRSLTASEFGGFTRPEDRNESYIESLSVAEASAYAESLGRCEQSAEDDAFAQIIEYQDVAESVHTAVSERMASDQEILALDSRWSSCMALTTTPDIVGSVPENPIEAMFGVQILASDAAFDDRAFWTEFLDLEREVATSSVSCAEELMYSEAIFGRTEELEQEELARRGYD